MGTVSQTCINGWHEDTNTWAQHSSVSLVGGYGRKGRLQFSSLSGGQLITSLSFTFYKSDTNGSGTLRFYVTTDAGLLPSAYASAQYLGEMPQYGSGTGWKTLAVPSSMFEGLSQFTGTWYLILSDSISLTFNSYGTNACYFSGTYADGSMYYSDGGVMKISTPYTLDGGIMKPCTAYYSDGGVMKICIP